MHSESINITGLEADNYIGFNAAASILTNNSPGARSCITGTFFCSRHWAGGPRRSSRHATCDIGRLKARLSIAFGDEDRIRGEALEDIGSKVGRLANAKMDKPSNCSGSRLLLLCVIKDSIRCIIQLKQKHTRDSTEKTPLYLYHFVVHQYTTHDKDLQGNYSTTRTPQEEGGKQHWDGWRTVIHQVGKYSNEAYSAALRTDRPFLLLFDC